MDDAPPPTDSIAVDRLLIFGNSGSGKSTLAARLAAGHGLRHLDLDPLAWLPGTPPVRRALADALAAARDVSGGSRWVIEGCYADLIDALAPRCTGMILLNPGVEACRANARARPWEPHKYATPEAQDASLAMLLDWIGTYDTRTDEMSLAAHRRVFDAFEGAKVELRTAREIGAWR
jgi:adenylate kinase family enzyme